MHTDCTVPYGEVDGFSALLGYQTANAAGCKVRRICHRIQRQVLQSDIFDDACWLFLKVLIHPHWGTSVYPATLFTKAPVNVLKKVIEEVEAESSDTGYYQSFMTI